MHVEPWEVGLHAVASLDGSGGVAIFEGILAMHDSEWPWIAPDLAALVESWQESVVVDCASQTEPLESSVLPVSPVPIVPAARKVQPHPHVHSARTERVAIASATKPPMTPISASFMY